MTDSHLVGMWLVGICWIQSQEELADYQDMISTGVASAQKASSTEKLPPLRVLTSTTEHLWIIPEHLWIIPWIWQNIIFMSLFTLFKSYHIEILSSILMCLRCSSEQVGRWVFSWRLVNFELWKLWTSQQVGFELTTLKRSILVTFYEEETNLCAKKIQLCAKGWKPAGKFALLSRRHDNPGSGLNYQFDQIGHTIGYPIKSRILNLYLFWQC